jgi:monovalent cation/hydrogen antiporter
VHLLESIVLLLLAAVLLAAAARRMGAPYPAFLALGGMILAFVPGAPAFELQPDLALALFIAPVLLDAAFDSSPRDLKDNWGPLLGLVVVAVVLTTIAVAFVTRALVPEIPWAAAIALGAIVAPPDAAAATAVLRQVRLPHRLVTILEGESLLNDASALLIYRVAVRAAIAGTFSITSIAPTFLYAVAGSVVVGPAIAWSYMRLTQRVQDVPTTIILQFIGTFGVWILAERIGLSGVLTMVCFAITAARYAPPVTPARLRIPSYAVWETVVVLLNVMAFVTIGLQIRPILEGLAPEVRMRYFTVAIAVLVTVIVVRFAWVMSYNAIYRWRIRRVGFHPPRPMARPTVRGALIISWCGMRGIVSLAAALALPMTIHGGAPFPFRDLIVLTAFCVVLGTLVVQGLTLRPLLLAFDLRDDDPVGREVGLARDRALQAALQSLDGDTTHAAKLVRHEYTVALTGDGNGSIEGAKDGTLTRANIDDARRRALRAARDVLTGMRADGEIGDDAFHRLEEELDWIEMASAGTR